MLKLVRIVSGTLLALFGILLTIVPGSTLLILLGLVILSYDIPQARNWLKRLQRCMYRSAKKLDTYLLARKLR